MPEYQGLQTVDFDYPLPPELIAQHPADRRDGARMMVLHRADQRIEHRRFADLPDYLQAGDMVVVNNTKVIPARLFARKPGTGGRAELFLLEQNQDGTWLALMRCRRRPDPGQYLDLEGDGGRADVLSYGEEGQVVLRFTTREPFLDYLAAFGHTPLPPYIKRVIRDPSSVVRTSDHGSQITDHDAERYQTIYAQTPGAVAAPTAGLHFTPQMFAQLEALGVSRVELTLHVGIGTFRPVKTERVQDHVMHEERYEVSVSAAEAIQRTRAGGGRIVAVGSTTVRTLEAVARDHGSVVAASGRTGIFIYPPYTFRAVDLMLTNFHLPQSTLLMMVCALAGQEFVLHAYAEAVKEKYRFFSYGDCMLIV
jgi:S-adenosylmethionine:tRNA ribosyltransferase-isomerase